MFLQGSDKLTLKGDMISGVGKDENGKKLLSIIEKGVNIEYILMQKKYPPGEVNVILNDKGITSFDNAHSAISKKKIVRHITP